MNEKKYNKKTVYRINIGLNVCPLMHLVICNVLGSTALAWDISANNLNYVEYLKTVFKR